MIILGWIGAGLATAGLLLGAWQFHSLGSREITVGKVTELIPQRGSKGGTTYKTVAEYRDHEGRAHTYRSSYSSSPAPYKVGDPIRICFMRDDPASGASASFGVRFGPAWVMVGVGVLLVWIAWGFSAGRPWIEKAFPPTVPGPAQVEGP